MAPRLMYLDLASPTEAQKKTTKNSSIHREDPTSRELFYHITCPFSSIPTTFRSTAQLPCGNLEVLAKDESLEEVCNPANIQNSRPT